MNNKQQYTTNNDQELYAANDQQPYMPNDQEPYAAYNQPYVPNTKKNPINELKYGTITITYKSNSYIKNLFGNKNKPKYAHGIFFNFDKDDFIWDKKSISINNNFIFTSSYNSPSPLIITNTENNKSFYKIISSLKTNQNVTLSELKILQTYQCFPNIIPSAYNCIYHSHDFDYSGHRKYILVLGCIHKCIDFWKFIFSYNPNEIKKEDVLYLLQHILYNNF